MLSVLTHWIGHYIQIHTDASIHMYTFVSTYSSILIQIQLNKYLLKSGPITSRCLPSEDLGEPDQVLLQGVFDLLREKTWEEAPTRKGRGQVYWWSPEQWSTPAVLQSVGQPGIPNTMDTSSIKGNPHSLTLSKFGGLEEGCFQGVTELPPLFAL